MSEKVILDASALLVLIQNEDGAEVVKPLLKHAAMSAVNVAEALAALQGINIPPKEALVFISDIIGTIVPFDMEQACCVAELQKDMQHKGLSLGDLSCIALGIILEAPIYTANKILSELNLKDADIRLIR